MPKDSIEHFLVSEGLGYYKDENITIKGFDLLKYRVPLEKIKKITPFYAESLIIWYSINLHTTLKNLRKTYICFNPLITDENEEVFEPLKVRGKTQTCKNNTIHDLLFKAWRHCKRPVFDYLKKIKIPAQNLNQIYTDDEGYIFEKN